MEPGRTPRRLSTVAILVIVVLGSFTLGLTFTLAPVISAVSTSSWSTSTSITTADPYSCAVAAGKIFCVGPATLTYYATEGSSGIGAWSTGTAYPVSTGFNPYCVSDGSYIYCIGGGTATTSVYSDSIGSSGFGATWTSQNAYPFGVELNTCVLASGYIYCVGGISGTAGVTTTEYATASGGTIGTWSSSTVYPSAVFGEGCAALSGYIYCVGGNTDPTLGISITKNAYRATISSTGIGTWSAASYAPTSAYPISCTAASSTMYCFGGTGYWTGLTYGTPQNYTMITSAAIWPYWETDAGWQQTPLNFVNSGCTNDGTTLFCVGGYSNWNTPTKTAVTQYAAIPTQPSNPTWSSQSTVTGGGNIGSSCGLYNAYAYCVQTNGTTRYATASGGVVGSWSKSTAYPVSTLNLIPPACAIWAGYIYCLGGSTGGSFTATNGVYSAPVSSSGFGAWSTQSTFPTNIEGPAVVASAGFLYVIGGQTSTCCNSYTSATYAASLTAGTVGTWVSGTAYPTAVYDPGISIVGNTVVVVAGYISSSTAAKQVYTASLSTISPWIGSWTHTGNYPAKSDGENCPYDGVQVVCVGADYYQDTPNNAARDFHTSLVYGSTDNGATWTRLANLPFSSAALTSGSCLADAAGWVYCFGGSPWEDNAGNWIWTGLVVSGQPDPPATTTTQRGAVIPPPSSTTLQASQVIINVDPLGLPISGARVSLTPILGAGGVGTQTLACTTGYTGLCGWIVPPAVQPSPYQVGLRIPYCNLYGNGCYNAPPPASSTTTSSTTSTSSNPPPGTSTTTTTSTITTTTTTKQVLVNVPCASNCQVVVNGSSLTVKINLDPSTGTFSTQSTYYSPQQVQQQVQTSCVTTTILSNSTAVPIQAGCSTILPGAVNISLLGVLIILLIIAYSFLHDRSKSKDPWK